MLRGQVTSQPWWGTRSPGELHRLIEASSMFAIRSSIRPGDDGALSFLMSKYVDDLRAPMMLFEAVDWLLHDQVATHAQPNFEIFRAAGLWWHFLRWRSDMQLRNVRIGNLTTLYILVF